MAAAPLTDSPPPALWRDLLPLLRAEDAPAPVSGPRRWWGGALDVEGLALGAAQAVAAAVQGGGRAAGRPLAAGVTSAGTAASFASYLHLRVNGRAADGFAPLSGFHRTGDGWIRLHANYPHHERALFAALGVRDTASLAAALLECTAENAEEAVTAQGGVAAAVRTPRQWADSAPGRAVQDGPWIRLRTAPAPVPKRNAAAALRGGDGAVLQGLRVLDFTRVIAGPSGSRLLGALGADVLRIDPPATPELPEQYLDTGFSKRSAVADLHDPAALRRIRELLTAADIVLLGYRGRSLTRFGLDPESLRAEYPGLGVVSLDAWGDSGPWAGRRGFDSVVQAAVGIASIYGDGDGDGRRPGALPVQALDYATGLGAAAAAVALMGARLRGISGWAHLSLARTALELLRLPGSAAEAAVGTAKGGAEGTVAGSADRTPAGELDVDLRSCPSAYGDLVFVPPPLLVDGHQVEHRWPPGPYGGSDLTWQQLPGRPQGSRPGRSSDASPARSGSSGTGLTNTAGPR